MCESADEAESAGTELCYYGLCPDCLLLLTLWLKLQRRCDRVISWEPRDHLFYKMFSDGRVLTHLVVVARLDAHWDLTLEKTKQNKETVSSGNCK